MNLEFDKNISIQVVRTDRKKTASIKIEDGLVRVIVPRELSNERISELIKKKSPWIRQKLRQQSAAVIPKPKEYVSGESFTYLGRNFRLKLVSGGLQEVKLKGGYFQFGVSKGTKGEDIQNALVQWYEEHALERLTKKTTRYAGIMGVSPNSISVREYKSRWGSCSSKGDISYNWRTIIAPHHIVDYVVVHELCHIEHPDHSPAYWKSVEREIPDYMKCRAWLLENAVRLTV